MKPPIFIDDQGDVLIFDSLMRAESYLEPSDVKCGRIAIFDSEGRILHPSVHEVNQKIAFFWTRTCERIVLEPLEGGAKHPMKLRSLLVDFLSKIIPTTEPLISYPLEKLVEMSLKFKIE